MWPQRCDKASSLLRVRKRRNLGSGEGEELVRKRVELAEVVRKSLWRGATKEDAVPIEELGMAMGRQMLRAPLV